MPLNESSGLFSNLTEKEQKEAMAAVYGLGDLMSPEALTYEDRVRMRRLLDQMDQKDAVGSTKEFDLNKPPTPPYQYREFPFLLYHHTQRQTKPAKNQEERERMLASGWSEEPFPSEPVEVLLTSDEQAEAEEVNQKLKKRRA
jgi:hypothetical protein